MKWLSFFIAASLLFIASFSGAEPVAPPAPMIVPTPSLSLPPLPERPSSSRLWNLQDADILSVINEVSQETGKNFVVDPRVTGKITLISSKPIRKSEVYQVFLSVLGLLGYSAIPSGNVIKIVPNLESGEQATRVATNFTPGKGDEVVVRVIPLKNISATQLIPILRPLLPQWSNISAYTPGNVIILLGRAANISRLYEIVRDVDTAANNGIQIISLRHSSAAQVATVINNLQSAGRAVGETASVSVAVDERTNSILLGGPKALRLRMRVLIAHLDAPSATPSGNTEVVYLRYLEAKTFAPLLGRIAQNIIGKEGNREVGGISRHESTVSSSAPSSSTTFNYGASSNSNNTNAMGNTNNATTSAVPKEIITNSTYIQAEPSTNAVIITAPPALMRALKAVIAKLDIRPAQVLVEAIIAEVDESNLTNLGIQWGSVTPGNADIPPSTTGAVTDFPNLGAGVFGIMPHVQIRTVLNLLQNQNGVNILSTPQIVVLDNQKASIEIGQMVSVQTGQYATSNAGVASPTPFTTNEYKNVTLRLDVTPQINLGRSVRLQLDLKNDTLQNPQNPGVTPLINTSKIKNSVIINSDDILVLGGLISTSNNENINKVPLISSIPIIGELFQQKVTNQQKKNLMVFIKPIILHTGEDAMAITHTKYGEMKSIQGNYTEDLENIGKDPMLNTMPPWKNTKDLPKPFETKP